MSIKSSQTLVAEALKEIKTINSDEAYKLSQNNNCNLIDIREAKELEKTGKRKLKILKIQQNKCPIHFIVSCYGNIQNLKK